MGCLVKLWDPLKHLSRDEKSPQLPWGTPLWWQHLEEIRQREPAGEVMAALGERFRRLEPAIGSRIKKRGYV